MIICKVGNKYINSKAGIVLIYMVIIMGSGYHFYFMYRMYCDSKL